MCKPLPTNDRYGLLCLNVQQAHSTLNISLNLLLLSQLPLDGGSGPASCSRMIKQIEYSLNAIISNNVKLWNSS